MTQKKSQYYKILAFSLTTLCGLFSSASFAGGMHSGGGSGIATYRPGAPKTPENLIRVESLAMFKARQQGLIPASVDSDKLQDGDAEIEAARAMTEVKKMLQSASDSYSSIFSMADTEFHNALERSRVIYDVSKDATVNGEPVSMSIGLINDYGDLQRLAKNQEVVQIIKRTGSNFTIDMHLWRKLSALDRLDLRIHEDAYAVSWQKDSTLVQKFELYIIQHWLSKTPIEKAEFQNKADLEWKFFQVNHSVPAVKTPGLKLVDEGHLPYSDLAPLIVNGKSSDVIPPGVPVTSREGLQCGIATDISAEGRGGRLTLTYFDGKKGRKSVEKLSEKEWKLFLAFQQEAEASLLAQINPMMVPYVYDYVPAVCFEQRLGSSIFGFGDLKYIEFRKAYDKKKLAEAQARAAHDEDLLVEIESELQIKIISTFSKMWHESLTESNASAFVGKLQYQVQELNDLIENLLSESESSKLLALESLYEQASSVLNARMDEPAFFDQPFLVTIPLLDYAQKLMLITYKRTSQEMYVIQPPPFVPVYGESGQFGTILPKADPIVIASRIAADVQ